jgi:hypothetical protein
VFLPVGGLFYHAGLDGIEIYSEFVTTNIDTKVLAECPQSDELETVAVDLTLHKVWNRRVVTAEFCQQSATCSG